MRRKPNSASSSTGSRPARTSSSPDATGSSPLEVADAFQEAVRHKRIDSVYRDASLAELAMLPITFDQTMRDRAWSATLRLAERFSLRTFDAAYLELAHRRGLPLATVRTELQAAAEQLGIHVTQNGQERIKL